MSVILCDIDGTIANGEHRTHLIRSKPKDWDKYFDLCHLDTPIYPMRDILKALSHTIQIVYVTGRMERTRVKTREWLMSHNFPDGAIFMRQEGDFKEDHLLKMEMLKKARDLGWEPLMVFDDRNRVVAAWREAGLLCAQVADGDY
jgi:phosphatidate phosphatase APP1